jgi:hypothetical protein
MTPDLFLTSVIDPGLDALAELDGPEPSDDVCRFLLAVALQESGTSLSARYQSSPSTSPGPARGWWQFECGGGVAGVLSHAASKSLAAAVCAGFEVVCAKEAVWRALEGHDLLATCFARLLLYTDPFPVPTNESDAWDCYANRLWRPGKPHPDSWPANWATATSVVTQAERGAGTLIS